jgi:proteasome component ECM29
VNFVARYGGEETLHAIAPRVVSRLRDFIENQGWPRVGGNEDLISRGYAYEVIGLLAKAGPRELLVETEGANLDLLRYLFSSLAQDTSGGAIIVSIEEALSTLLSAIARLTLNASEQSVLEDLLIEEMELSSDLEANKRMRSTKYVTVRFANRCLPFNSVKARWVDVLGIGARGERMELREEAERGLSPYWYRMLNGSFANSGTQSSVSFPAFNTVIEEFFTGRTIDSDEEAMAVARNVNKLRKHCFAHMTAFARRILLNEALIASGNPPNMDHEWERRLDAAAESDEKARQAIKKHMLTVGDGHPQALAILECALFEGVAADPSAPQDHLVEFLSLASNELVQKLAPAVDQLLPSVMSNHHNARMAAAHAYAIIATHPIANSAAINSQIEQLIEKSQAWQMAIGAQANQVHGAVVALGFFFGRTCYRNPADFKSNELYQNFLLLLMEMIMSAKDALIKEATFVALGQLCMFGAFESQEDTIRQVIDKVYEVAKTGNEQATLCLGQISMVLNEREDDAEDNNLTYVVEQLHKLHEVRQAEVHFGVGEAFSYVASGWKSSALAAKLDIEGSVPNGPKRQNTLERLADRFIRDCAQTKPSLKKAAAMWLLCLVQFCGEEQEIQSRLGPIQVAFKRCLTDRDELVQETASRGLGLVYEKGDRSLKDDLVRDLVSSFSSDKPTGLSGTVSADTQLFEPGALPTGDGSVSTYKDIMSLASEVGDSSLVYRFMSMASSNAIWSSRAAFGRFGLSNVLSDSSVDGYLAGNPKLYPKLFRYRFDPNQGVQRSMNDIWNALVKDSSATIDKHFDAIVEDLLTSVLGKEWRTRQASCAAIADLVSGRPMEKYEPYLERIWNSCFKVLDDIKDSVRTSAASLARTLTGILTRALEADHSSTKTASSMLKHVLPFLLSPSGMESSAQEVQSFAVRTLLEIVKKSNGQTLRPFIPELVERLIGLLSSLEPEAVNYIHLNASKYNLTEQKIDDMRLSSVRSSPIMEAIERCLDLVNEETMRELQPRLANAMKSAVGLPSKVGSSRILVSLSTRRMAIFKPVADDFMKLIEKLVLDRNETVASSYAAAAGYVARHASDKQILKMVAFAKGLYFDSEHDRERRR